MKPVIYQIFTRLFTNQNTTRKHHGTLQENGCGKMNDYTPYLLNRIKQLGVTHLWFTGIIRHASRTDYSANGIPTQHPSTVKGMAGSPYAIADYYDIDPDLAENVDERMHEFEALIHRTHREGLGFIIDFVPNHLARQYRSIAKSKGLLDFGSNDDTSKRFSLQNNYYYLNGTLSLPSDADKDNFAADRYIESPAKATGNDCFSSRPTTNDWYETVKLNYGIDYHEDGSRSECFSPTPRTWNMMVDILNFWASKGIDGFRCDMAEMVPQAFWSYAIPLVKKSHPHLIFIGEVYNPSLYRTYVHAGFDFLYDKVGMYDCLRDIICRRRPACDISHQWMATDDIGAHMLYFLENHDEQRIGSDYFARDATLAIPALMVLAWMRNNPLMIYAGQEFGETGMDDEGFSGRDGRTTIFDYWCVESIRRGYFSPNQADEKSRSLYEKYRQVLAICHHETLMKEGQFFDLMYVNPHLCGNYFTFLRTSADTMGIVVVNFSDDDHPINVIIPQHAFDLYKLKGGKFMATELMSRRILAITIEADRPITLPMTACSGGIWKINKN